MASVNFLVVLLLLATAMFSLPAPSNTSLTFLRAMSTQHLQKRQCVRSPADDQGVLQAYHCDNRLPTMDEWVTRIRDVNDRGLASPDHHALLYTGLLTPQGANWDQFLEWTAGWIEDKQQNKNQQFYWWFRHTNSDWRGAQAAHIDNNEEAMVWGDTWGPPGTTPYALFDWCNYQAISAAAIHPVAYVLLTKGTHPKDRNRRPDSAWARMEFWALTHNPNVLLILRANPRPPSELGITEEQML